MQLNKGQKVAYPNQGVCMVENIENKTIGKEKMKFYSLRVLSDNSTILVPKDNAETVGLRPIISKVQCKKLIKELSSDFENVSSDWKSRSKEFGEKLRSGDVFETADVLKKLTFLSLEKKLSFREQNLMDKAKALIISEIVNADRSSEDELSREIDKLVEKACNKHQKTQPSVMATSH